MQRTLLALFVVGMMLTTVPTDQQSALGANRIFSQLVPRKKIESNPQVEYSLTKEHGPWLVMATSFSGLDGEAEARQLVWELRSKNNLPAYYYGMSFQLGEENPGRGIDAYGGRIKRRYQRGEEVVQHAVLVGDFSSLNDPAAQQMLKRIKRLRPEALSPQEGKSTSQSLAAVRHFQNLLKEKMGASTRKGPMGHAFLTRNPLLPKEYFVPQGVDKEVAKWNKGLEYSLIKCPGNFSMRVATFRGRSSLKAANSRNGQDLADKPSNALVTAAENAHFLTTALREKGWEAYEFHDRQESYVTVGSFQDGVVRPNGQIVLQHPDAKTIVNTFGARTPHNIFNQPAQQDLLLEQRQKARFQQLFSENQGQFAQGLHPKRFVGLPFDIDPKPVRVPRQSISSVYARN
ncbi:MAG: hypothetical protein MI725_08635 [Pirellulales bacterium]|nr:hypothetical protein [Pirellulales bacterium]